ncbi:MAG: hypothetical protein ACYS9Y_07710 [Planctomycetota bacterium]
MFNSRSLKNVVLFVLAGMVCIGGSAFAAESSDELLGLIPAESILAVRLNNFDTTFSQLDTYLAGVSPVPIGLTGLARMQFGQILGNPELKGVNTSGNFGAYAVAQPGQMAPSIKVLVPVSDYAEFVSASSNVGEPDASGISKVTINDQSFAVVKKAGNYAVFAKAGDSVNIAVDTGLETAIDTAEKTLAGGQPIWAYANVERIGEVYGEMAVEHMKNSKTMMADMKLNMETMLAGFEKQRAEIDVNDPNQQETIELLDKQIASTKESIKQLDSNLMMENFGNVMDMYIRIVETLLNESKSFSLGIEPGAEVLTILETYTALPGSESAKALVADTSGAKADKLVNYLQDGAMVNFACRLNKPLLQNFYNEAIGLMDVMSGGEMTDDEVAKMKEITTDILDSVGGAMAASLWADETASPPFMEDCIIEVSDAEKFNKTLLNGIELWKNSGFMNFYKKMGLETNFVTQMNVYEYKEVKVNSASLKFKAADPNSQEAQIIEKMYGDGFDYRWATVDGLCVEAIAGDVEAAIRQLIDEVKAGGASEAATDIKQALTMLGDGADDFFGTFNVVRMLKMMSAMPSFPIPDISVESKSNIAFGGKIGDGKVVLKVAVPKAHIGEVIKVVVPKPATQ